MIQARCSEAKRGGAAERAKTVSKELLAMLISVIPTVQPSRYFDPKAAAAAPAHWNTSNVYIPHGNRPIVKQS